MKKIMTLAFMCAVIGGLGSCKGSKAKLGDDKFTWIIDRFDDIKILRFQVPGFEKLPLQEKMLVYYLSQSALCGRDIIYDQNFKLNLPIRRTLEAMYEKYDGSRNDPQWLAFEKYLKKVWLANGIHHHYSNEKFVPEFSESFFDELLSKVDPSSLPQECGSLSEMVAVIKPAIFDPSLYPLRVNQTAGEDMLASSAMNYYDGVSQKEAEKFYATMVDPKSTTPISYGLNSQLVKEDGKIVERVWRVGGMYSGALEKVVYWLEKASEVANPAQKKQILTLIGYYRSGDLREFDAFNVQWVQDTVSRVDFVNGFTESYGDPLGFKAAWESMVNIKDEQATKRTETISGAAQWFEDHSPIDDKYKKTKVRGVSAKVINAAILGGECYPTTPVGINLPNSAWIRRDFGSKSVTIDNITHAYNQAARGNGFLEEFMLHPADRARVNQYGELGESLHIDIHECLGHGSGVLAPKVSGDELKNYGSVIEEARADLFGLYYLADQKMVDLGLIPTLEVAKAQYSTYIMNGMMTQLTRIKEGRTVEQAHMRNRKIISEWSYELGRADNVIEWVSEGGKRYVVVNDFDKLRLIFGQMLREIQRIKSEGDFKAARALVETYGVQINPELHKEVARRYAALKLEPYSGFVNPAYKPIMENGEIVDIKIEYPDNYVGQMLEYSKNFSFLPCRN